MGESCAGKLNSHYGLLHELWTPETCGLRYFYQCGFYQRTATFTKQLKLKLMRLCPMMRPRHK